MRAALLLALLWAQPLPAQDSFRNTVAIVAEPLSVLLPDLAGLPTTRDGPLVSLGFTGDALPPALDRFLSRHAPGADLPAAGPWRLSLALLDQGETTRLSLMIAAPLAPATAAFGPTLPPGLRLVLDDASGGACRGQIVLQADMPPRAAVATATQGLRQRGFTVQDDSRDGVSFFVGRRSDCDVVLYIEADEGDPDKAAMVLRYLED